MGTSERSSLVMMVATFLSRLLGILKSRALSVHFGSSAIADGINFTFNLANNLRKIFAEGSLSQSTLTVLSSEADDDRNALYNRIASFLVLVFAFLFIISLLFGKGIVEALSGFGEGQSLEVASSLLPFFTLFLFFISLSILTATLLQVRHRFLASAVAPILLTLSVLISLTFFSSSLGHYSMALGVLVGSIAQFLVVALPLVRSGARLKLDFNFRDKDFRRVIGNFLPSSLSALASVLSQMVTMYLASTLGEGSVSALSYAIVFYSAPYGIFFSSITAVYFPQLSSAVDEKDRAKTLSTALSYLYTFLLPSLIILSALSKDIVSCLLQKGAFTYEDTLATASVLDWYLVAMIPMGFYAMLQRHLLSRGGYRKNLGITLATSVLDMALMFILSPSAGLISMPLSSAISSTVGLVLVFTSVKAMEWASFARRLVRTSLANMPVLLLFVVYKKWNPQFYLAGSSLSTVLFTALLGLVFMLVTLVSYRLFSVDFLSAIRNRRP